MTCIDDGQCVVDVQHRQGQNYDFASFAEIRSAAEKVMQRCIDPINVPAIGGYIGNVGM